MANALKYTLVNGLYNIENFDAVKTYCTQFIEDTIAENAPKKARSIIRKKNEEIAKFRKEATKALLGDFTGKCKELESMLKQADDALKQEMDASKEQKPEETASCITITCKVYDEETLQKATQFLESLGLKVETTAN